MLYLFIYIMAPSLRVSWAYTLRREDLLTYLEEFGCQTTGTVDELRRRFALLLSDECTQEQLDRFLELQERHEKPSTSQEAKFLTPMKTPSISITSAPTPSVEIGGSEKANETGGRTTILPKPNVPAVRDPRVWRIRCGNGI